MLSFDAATAQQHMAQVMVLGTHLEKKSGKKNRPPIFH